MVLVIEKDNYQEYIGADLGVTDWLMIDQIWINQFADATLDHQHIHVDPELAKQTPFGSTIAHGFLSLSLLSFFAEQIGVQFENSRIGLNYGFDKVRFLNPVKVDSKIRGRGRLVDIKEKAPNQYLVKMAITVEIEDQKKSEFAQALYAEWLIMIICDP